MENEIYRDYKGKSKTLKFSLRILICGSLSLKINLISYLENYKSIALSLYLSNYVVWENIYD